MPTNSIGKNNALVGLCLDRDMKALLGKEACAEDRSLASFLLHHAMENIRRVKPSIAVQADAIRTERLRLKHGLVVLAAGLLTVWISMTGGDVDARRGRTARTFVKVAKKKDADGGFDGFTANPHDSYGEVHWATITETQPA